MKDRVLLFLAVVGFIILLSLGVSPIWSIGILLFAIIGYLGLRYPKGSLDVKTNKKESAYSILSILMVLIVVYLLYTVLQIIELPPIVDIITIISWIGVAAIFLLSIFYPKGYDKIDLT
ncbi:MAG: hypothetical protein ACLFVB_10310 [Thermoplasmata archaeon]